MTKLRNDCTRWQWRQCFVTPVLMRVLLSALEVIPLRRYLWSIKVVHIFNNCFWKHEGVKKKALKGTSPRAYEAFERDNKDKIVTEQNDCLWNAIMKGRILSLFIVGTGSKDFKTWWHFVLEDVQLRTPGYPASLLRRRNSKNTKTN